ncbi:nitroreductase [Acinetobacter sp. ME22]|uniref:nitroreductase family protein n=1 Tax=Acinetobacter sp. ME22 TaxID=2904802 RepID=UPI001EDC10DE|nr:nitroreductase [Acinetobacter sp. ME22]MCG2572588.1 nitroreductase [Acinetobacter sp. ME22]
MANTTVQAVHDNIQQRQSVGLLVEPAPTAQQLDLAFAAALTAPDHHRLKPTRFVVVETNQRIAFGELVANSMQQDFPEIDPVQIERIKNHPMRAPLLVLALTHLVEHPKVPEFEQILSSGAAVQNLLLSLESQGFASMWRTGAIVESVSLKKALGLQAHDLISGVIYVGTAAKALAPRAELTVSNYVSYWSAP